MSDSLYARLHGILYPGQAYSIDRSGELAAKLREVADSLEQGKSPSNTKSKHRELDFGLYQTRYVALEVLYVGHDYHGFAKQDTSDDTIEEHLFAAFIKTRLIPVGVSWQEINYSRGGRTDKGVSGLGQVVALTVRSGGRVDLPPLTQEEEYDYPSLLNGVLPPEIRVLGWTDAPQDFSARFSARFREYKYFIVDDAKLDVDAMRTAASHLLGEHDFRNFCKPDVTAVKTFVRNILEVQLTEMPGLKIGERKVLVLFIRGTAFLWHQVRCIAALLLMVGRGQEQPEIVKTLLDIEGTPRKPGYLMASEEPLLFYSCAYGQGLGPFRRCHRVYRDVLTGIDNQISR